MCSNIYTYIPGVYVCVTTIKENQRPCIWGREQVWGVIEGAGGKDGKIKGEITYYILISKYEMCKLKKNFGRVIMKQNWSL